MRPSNNSLSCILCIRSYDQQTKKWIFMIIFLLKNDLTSNPHSSSYSSKINRGVLALSGKNDCPFFNTPLISSIILGTHFVFWLLRPFPKFHKIDI